MLIERGSFLGGESSPVVLNQRYALTSQVRQGGMSTVTKAADLKTQKFVAVKMMLSGGDSRRKQESINRESRALEVLRHPNIVSLIDGGKDGDGATYLVLLC